METFLLEIDVVSFSGENVNHYGWYVFVWAEEGRFIAGNGAIYLCHTLTQNTHFAYDFVGQHDIGCRH